MRLDHGGLLVSDVERAARFYVDALGLERIPRPPTFDTPGAWLNVGEHHQIHLIGETEPGRALHMNPGLDGAEIAIGYGNHLALVVDDLDAAVARARAAGVEPGGEIIARGDGVRRTFVTDPDRNMIELMEFGVPVTGEEPRLTAPQR
ncbi:VOC family protein [Solirubrobacter soli]|uniref:VOC family protein n=1 Tax=Solirubrobacter soli TaxID=363832 RepID=UPI000406F7CF|nr:VOC family protein [Solirubrobacter soli]